MIAWKIHASKITASTNTDARKGVHGDVFTAEMQTAGRGRLNHEWLSPSGENLLASAVFDVVGVDAAEVAAFPLVVGLSVAETIERFVSDVKIKWPNDVWIDGKKVCGILCERNGDCVIAGIGINVRQKKFPPPIEKTATSLALENPEFENIPPSKVLDAVLETLGRNYSVWKEDGFGKIRERLIAFDALCGREISVRQTDDGDDVVSGLCGGIADDGSLLVGGVKVYAGEAHVIL